MNKPPAFQFYADDFIGGTITMTHEERGLYILLLCLQWTQGAITKDDAARVGSTVVEPSLNRVLTKFPDVGNGMLQNKRLESEREKQIAFRERQINAGKASAQARFNRGSTVVQPDTQPKANSPSPSPSSSPNLNLNVIDSPLIDSPKPAKKPAGEHRQMIDAWRQAYEEAHGTKFFVTNRDGKAAKDLLASGVKPDEVASLAKAAWANKGKDSWNCQNRTATLYDFADAFMKIKQELGKLGVSAQSGPKRDARGRIPFVDYMPDAPIAEGPRPDPKELFAKLRAEAEAAAKAKEEAENPFNESSHDL
jgi:uncharacterized protein YdaU (DUF1376 family)